jgi:hypothetical protein
MVKTTLPTDSAERKEVPINSGVLKYAPAAIAGVARISMAGNRKHNGDQPLHHARGKSSDHSDCVLRHAMDVNDIEAYIKRNLDNGSAIESSDYVKQLLNEASQLCWRALMWSQELHETYGGAPLAPGAKLPSTAAPGYSTPGMISAGVTAAELGCVSPTNEEMQKLRAYLGVQKQRLDRFGGQMPLKTADLLKG